MSLPVLDLLVERLQEYDPKFEARPGTPFYDLFIAPLTIILQPFQNELDAIAINQSFRRIVELEDPNAYDEDAVDALASDLFVDRVQGGKAAGTARIYYAEPTEVVFSANALEFKNSAGDIYNNATTINISAPAMAKNTERDMFFVDVSIVASDYGDNFNLENADMLVEVSDARAVTVTNKAPVVGGRPRETNLEYIDRTKNSVGVRDMNTGKGGRAIMFEAFADTILELQQVGFMDPEMLRDVAYNTHVGGKIDFYVKTTSLVTKTFDAIGVTIDDSRRVATATYKYMPGVEWVYLNVPRIDDTDRNVLVRSVTPNISSTFLSYVDLTSPVNLVGAERVKITLDGLEREIHVAGVVPATTVINEIVRKINNAFGRTVATVATNPIVIPRTSTGSCVALGDMFFDPKPNAFQNVSVGDSLYLYLGTGAGTRTVTEVLNRNTIRLSDPFPDDQFNTPYQVTRTGTFMSLKASREVRVEDPDIGNSALTPAFGLTAATSFYGSEPRIYNEAVGFEVDYEAARLRRIVGAQTASGVSTGVVSKGIIFYDMSAPDVFQNVQPGDILTITGSGTGSTALVRDYRVIDVLSGTGIQVDRVFQEDAANIPYVVTRTEILDGENVSVEYDYNPLAIDIGSLVPLDEFGRERGVRPGREAFTIQDVVLDISQVELIDPVTLEPLGQILESRGGYGRGGYGRGGYGRSSQSEWKLKVLDPSTRFSMWENSLILIDPSYVNQSFRVTYRTCADIAAYQAFADSDLERVLDAHVLIKHFIPALVSGTIEYSVDPNNPNTPAEDVVLQAVKDAVNRVPAGQALDVSDLVQVILNLVDPTASGKARVKLPVTLSAVIHNIDGTRTIVSDDDQLVIPTVVSNTSPLTPRTAHWVADDIQLVRR